MKKRVSRFVDSIDVVAKKLARAHREADPATSAIYRAPNSKEIRLVEVSSEIPNAMEVLPIGFDPDPAEGILFPSVVIFLSPAEWNAVQAGKLKLPKKWGSPSKLVPLPLAS